ncbi:hypothetical protein CXB51_018907 [Gossypium anomalum]|uniref:Integrase catalytic domain-containing protein n=1 Tax=Gossypium anomalum TaxID=47600 RepID=A0A8J5YVE2_9ROSI|nr:hypothetical protein CXB51_018907 [Gossypium anomalum]
MEVQYDKEDLGLILLCSLPPSYSTFRDTILYSRRESLTVDEGEGLIVRGRQDRNTDDDRGRTQERNHRGKSKGRSKSSNRGKTCNFCKNSVRRRGTVKSECYISKIKIKGRLRIKRKNNQKILVEADVVEDYSDGELLVASVNDSKVSEEWILDSGCTFHMSPNRDCVGTLKVKMFDGVVRTLSDIRVRLLLVMQLSLPLPCQMMNILNFWHMRLGHMSENGMVELSKRGLLDGQGICKLNFCEHCVFGKQKRVRFTRGIHNTKETLEYIHSDLWGPSRVPSRGGANYMLTFIDDFSRKVWAFFLKQKSDNNGLEFCSDEFNRLCKSEGIVRHLTVRHTPQQNGVAERMNRTIMEKVRCNVVKCQLTEVVWAEAASTACFLVNRSPSVAIEKKTPQEVWSGNPANYSDLKIFGCPAYAHVNNGKLEPRSIKCVFFLVIKLV